MICSDLVKVQEEHRKLTAARTALALAKVSVSVATVGITLGLADEVFCMDEPEPQNPPDLGKHVT